MGLFGYTFAINNNGYLLFHSTSEIGILGYNETIDLLETQIESPDLVRVNYHIFRNFIVIKIKSID